MDENPLKYCNVDQFFFTILGTLITLLPYWSRPNLAWDRTHIVYADTPNFTWMRSLSRLPVAKTTILGKFWHFGGLLYQPTFANDGQIWCARVDLWSMFTRQMPSWQVHFWFPAKTPNFTILLIRHFVVLPSYGNQRTLNTSAQPLTFPYPTVSNTFLYSNAFMAKSGAQTLTFKSVTDKQTDKQTKKLNVFGHPAAGEIRAPNLAWW